MNNKVFLSIFLVFTIYGYSQVGINETNPSATLDIKSKGNTGSTKALEINNSDDLEMVTVLDNGNVGINVPAPTAKLHTNGTVRYENLPQVSSSINPLAIDANGYVGTYTSSVLYSYLSIDTSQSTNNFSLSSTGIYYSFPFLSSGIIHNSLGITLGTDAAATLTRTVGNTDNVTNILYITIPNPGVYKINLNYYTACTGNTSGSTGGANFLGIGTGIYKAASGSTAYTEITTIRNNAHPLRNSNGTLNSPGQYNYPSPNNVFSILETTASNEKVALFVNWGTSDQFNTNVCSLSAPSGLDRKVTLIVSKL